MFPNRLTALRTRAGLTQRGLCALAGLDSKLVSWLERIQGPGSKISVVTVTSLAKALGCSVEYLWSGEGEEPSDEQIAAAVAEARARPVPVSLPKRRRTKRLRASA